MTYTYATLDVSPAVYREIRESLETAGYQHAFLPGYNAVSEPEVIDMHGIALHEGPAKRCAPRITGHVFVRCILPNGCVRADRCHWTDAHRGEACGALAEEHVA